MVQHARLPRLLNGFQPVEDDRGDRDWVLEPLRRLLAPPLSPAPKDTNAFAWAAEEEGYIRVCDGRQASGEELGGGEDLFIGAAVKGELVSVAAHEHGVPGAPILFGTKNNQLLFAILTTEDELLGRT